MATITICSDSVAPLILLEPKKTKVKEQIKIIVEDLELVLGDLKDVAKDLKEVRGGGGWGVEGWGRSSLSFTH